MEGFEKIMEDFKVGSVGSKSTNGFREYMFLLYFFDKLSIYLDLLIGFQHLLKSQ